MDQLSGLDASFLYLETDTAPMHIASVSILDPKKPDGSVLTLDDLRQLMESRLHLTRTFRQRLVEVPLNLGRPYWIDDDEFDITAHVERTQLPEPGGMKELSALAAWEFAQPLDRSRPLWHILMVEGVNGLKRAAPGSIAIISRIHHAAIDGVSGSEIMSTLYDVTPEPREVAPPEELPAGAITVPSKLDLLRKTGGNLGKVRQELTQNVKSTALGVIKSGTAWGRHKIKPPPFPFSAPRTRLNGKITKERAWSAELLDLERIKTIKNKADVKLNDVVLTVCSGALRQYLLEKDELPEKPLIAMVPISVRADEEKGTMGNQVSAMLVALATDEADPKSRLARIHEETVKSKTYHQAIGARTLGGYSQTIPFGIGGLAARLYTRMNLADRHNPIFNLVITNVPGPPIPLYVGGARLLAMAGAAPIFDGMGLILPVFSYAGILSIGAMSCPEIMPDIRDFTRALRTSLDELEAAL